MNEPNAKSVCGHAVEIRPQSGRGQFKALTAACVQAGKDLSSAPRSIGQSLRRQLPFFKWSDIEESHLKSLTVGCQNPSLFKGT